MTTQRLIQSYSTPRPCRRSVRRRLVVEPLEGRSLLSATPTSISVTTSTRQLSFGESETLTATVRAGLLGTPPSEGNVTFLDGSTALGTGAVTNGVASLTTTALAVGSHTITASYGGTANYAASQSGSVQSIIPGAGLNQPRAVAVDTAGDVFIADTSNDRVVMVTPVGTQSVVASGLNEPDGVAVDSSGDVFIADTGNNRVIEITPTGKQTTVGTGLVMPRGLAVDAAGDVFIADAGNSRVVEVTPEGTQQTVGSGLTFPTAVAVDSAGDVFIADTNNDEVLEVTSAGMQTTYVTGLQSPTGVAVDAAGDVFIAVSSDVAGVSTNQVLMVNSSLTETPVGLGLGEPTGVAVDGKGDVFIADVSHNQVLEESPGLPVEVSPARPSLTWANPADIPYGTPLGLTQLDATAPVPGTFAYSPRPGTLLPAGTDQSLSVTFTPADSTDYLTASAIVFINVDQATPVLDWATPASIAHGTPLSANQLDATANVPGAFTYTPALGTILPLGQGETLAVTFTPADTIDYTTVTTTTTINVVNPPPTIVGAHALFHRKFKHGKPTDSVILSGYTIDFGGLLDVASASLPSNYQVEVESIKNVKKRKVASLQPLTAFTVSYSAVTDSVSLLFTGQPAFNDGGQITVLGGPASGVTGASGAFVSGDRVLTIAPGGKTIALA